MLWFWMERSYIDQIAIWGVPHGVMYGDQIPRPRNVSNNPIMKHPTKSRSATILLHLAPDIFKAICRLSPNFRTVTRKAKRLIANCCRELFDMSWLTFRMVKSRYY